MISAVLCHPEGDVLDSPTPCQVPFVGKKPKGICRTVRTQRFPSPHHAIVLTLARHRGCWVMNVVGPQSLRRRFHPIVDSVTQMPRPECPYTAFMEAISFDLLCSTRASPCICRQKPAGLCSCDTVLTSLPVVLPHAEQVRRVFHAIAM